MRREEITGEATPREESVPYWDRSVSRIVVTTRLRRRQADGSYALVLTREEREDMADAHAEGLHDDLPREGCPECAR